MPSSDLWPFHGQWLLGSPNFPVRHSDQYLSNFCQTQANFISFAGMSDTFRHLWGGGGVQDKIIIEMPLHKTQGLEVKYFVRILKREMKRRDDYSIPLNLEIIRIFQTFTLYECKILASEASQKKYTNKMNTTLGSLLLHCPSYQTSTQDPISHKSQEGSRPQVPLLCIRPESDLQQKPDVFSISLINAWDTYHRHTPHDSRRDNKLCM